MGAHTNTHIRHWPWHDVLISGLALRPEASSLSSGVDGNGLPPASCKQQKETYVITIFQQELVRIQYLS